MNRSATQRDIRVSLPVQSNSIKLYAFCYCIYTVDIRVDQHIVNGRNVLFYSPSAVSALWFRGQYCSCVRMRVIKAAPRFRCRAFLSFMLGGESIRSLFSFGSQMAPTIAWADVFCPSRITQMCGESFGYRPVGWTVLKYDLLSRTERIRQSIPLGLFDLLRWE